MNQLIKQSTIKRFAKKFIGNVSPDFYKALDEKVKTLIEEAISKAKENRRTTLMKRDL